MDVAASYLGCTPAALRLLIGVLCGYPLAILYRHSIASKSTSQQHLYFTITGLGLIIFNYGWDTLHSLTNIAFVYIVLLLAGRSKTGLVINSVFTMGYLLVGYHVTATENYDIKWTMPHCILCLRLIGVAFDYYDGGVDDFKEIDVKKEELPTDRRATALKTMPSLLEMLGHSYFYGGCMVGPQFPMKRYKDFAEGKLWPDQRLRSPDSVPYSMKRLLQGIGAMVFFQVGSTYVNEKVMLTDEFLYKTSWTSQWMYFGMFSTVMLHKYVACWLMAEGSCALTGLAYNGKDEKGNNRWDGLPNIGLWQFELTTNFDGIIRSFNINTNKWVSQYVFKRLRFLGNKDVSQLAALVFLALWHGFHIGYYVCFILEFLVMKFERDFTVIVDMIPPLRDVIYHEKLRWPRLIFMKIYVACLFGYCLAPFALLKVSKIHKLYSVYYYAPVIFLLGWFAASLKFMPVLKKRANANPANLNSTPQKVPLKQD